ncbi:hypothetical protein TanjilG_03569 [Lupinus angustifolius]|uniref:Endonuclease/exonuclease/phosphatase domain-containing protein n=1 Tax=Lupinus angustifolius TaxID=3871 RepID=A0A1J7H4W2_LUPAN|nr:hypothetical protein TanjilG_03569 [Lupinus angustifolius]
MMQLRVCKVDDTFQFWITVVYANNQLEKRKLLWNDIVDSSTGLVGPWIVLGDFNNVLGVKDGSGGSMVQKKEYEDLEDMMQLLCLFEAESQGPHFTWSN